MKIPHILVIHVEHAPGNLAKVLTVVGEQGLTVEDLQMVGRNQDSTTWELTLELDGPDQLEIMAAIDKLPIARVMGSSDRVFNRHQGGKIETVSRSKIHDLQMLRDVYTPGVARVCLAIQDHPKLARNYTGIGNTVAIVTNGTAILGLGDIGAVAGMPVMEGKAALFSQLAGLSGVPILIESKDPDVIVDAVEAIAPSFGAVQLEDIRAPECFEIEEKLIERLDIPVLHDDQHGTAVVALAALISAARSSGVHLSSSVVGQIGLGAAGLGITRLLGKYGVAGVLGADLDEDALARLETQGGRRAGLPDLMAKADIVIATTGVKGLIKPHMVREGQLILALSNPEPEIEPSVALERGARFAADGKTINNVLGFPGLFRGALAANATSFTDQMLIAAAESISALAPAGELTPQALDVSVHEKVAQAVAEASRV
ncbi:MAG: malic enzyme-like NAD(P)-binding protein [Planctomycetota bacterium]